MRSSNGSRTVRICPFAEAGDRTVERRCGDRGGLGLVGLAVAPAPRLGVAVCVAIGLASGPLGVLLGSLSQAHTADDCRDRVSNVSTVTNLGISPLAIAATGIAVGQVGLLPTVIGCGLLSLLAALLCLVQPQLRPARLS
jgi:hypothetical protein